MIFWQKTKAQDDAFLRLCVYVYLKCKKETINFYAIRLQPQCRFRGASAEYCAVVGKSFAGIFAEFAQQILHGKVFLFLAGNVEDNFAVVHHNKTVAVLYGVVHIMSYHNCGKIIFFNDFVGNFKHLCRGFRVKSGGVLIQKQKLWLDKRCHNKGQRLARLIARHAAQVHAVHMHAHIRVPFPGQRGILRAPFL